MTLDEAINHAYDKYIELLDSCPKCSEEHYQLYLFLKELKLYKEKDIQNDKQP